MPSPPTRRDRDGSFSRPADMTDCGPVLRALREASGLSRETWADLLAVGRSTVQRWEQGTAVPSAIAEQSLLALCHDRGLWRAYRDGVLRGLTVTPDWLRDMLAAARLQLVDVAPGVRASHPSPPAAVGRGSVGNLPVPPTAMVGREGVLQAASERLSDHAVRLLTLTGPGGTGKTRAAIEIGHRLRARYRDGVYFASLASVRAPELVAATIANTVGLRQRGEQTVLETLKKWLTGKEVLLILDNCEQLDGCEPLIAELCTVDWGVQVLATSRAPLSIRAEHLLDVEPLPVPDPDHLPPLDELRRIPSVSLFEQRAHAVNQAFAVSEGSAVAVARIVERLDGLPLALELAAVRVRSFSPEELWQQLNPHVLPVLTGGPRDLPRRQQSLRDTIAWSYYLLSPAAQRLFRRLSVFAGGWTADAALQVCDQQGDLAGSIEELLDALAEQHLLEWAAQPDGSMRYAMLETIREFAESELIASGEFPAVRSAHLRWCIDVAHAAGRGMRTAEQSLWVARLDDDLKNMRRALEWALANKECETPGLELVSVLTPYWWRGHLREGRDWFELFLEPERGRGTVQRARALERAAFIVLNVDGFRNSFGLIRETVHLGRSLGIETLVVGGLSMMATALAMRGDEAEARRTCEESVSLARRTGNPNARRQSLVWGSRTALWLRDPQWAEQLAHELITPELTAGDALAQPTAWCRLGQCALLRGDFDYAKDFLEQALAYWRNHSLVSGAPTTLAAMGRLSLALHDPDMAQRYFREGIELTTRSASVRESLPLLSGVAASWADIGNSHPAIQLFGFLDAISDQTWIPLGTLYRGEFDSRVVTLRSAVGESRFASIWASGGSLTYDQAIRLALQSDRNE